MKMEWHNPHVLAFINLVKCLDLSHVCDMDRAQNKHILESQTVLLILLKY